MGLLPYDTGYSVYQQKNHDMMANQRFRQAPPPCSCCIPYLVGPDPQQAHSMRKYQEQRMIDPVVQYDDDTSLIVCLKTIPKRRHIKQEKKMKINEENIVRKSINITNK